MTELAQVRLEVRQLKARVAVLEKAQAARPACKKREARPRPSNAIIAEREALWAKFVNYRVISKLSFAVAHRLNPSEFCRWLSAGDKRGIPEGSSPDLLFRRVLAEAIKAREGRQKTDSDTTRFVSRGRMPHSQFSDDRPH